MGTLITVGLRLLLWCLLTGDLEAANVAIGLAVALALPRFRRGRPVPPLVLLRAVGDCLVALPQAYLEAWRMLRGQAAGDPVREEIVRLPAEGRGSALLVFLEVFRVTLTPFTLVLDLEPDGRHYRVHRLAYGRGSHPGECQPEEQP
ncbi:MAG: Na+/H+ antiporter subunit E [Synechococcus sp.]|nr:Na+/H+ antiporter subunit E [Synechococcus sp.]